MAKRYGVPHPLALINNTHYLSTLSTLGVEKMVNPAHLAIAILLKRLSKDYVKNFYPLEEYSGIVIEAALRKTSPILKKSLRALNTDKMKILAIERRGKIIWKIDSLRVGDTAIIILQADEYKNFQELFDPK